MCRKQNPNKFKIKNSFNPLMNFLISPLSLPTLSNTNFFFT